MAVESQDVGDIVVGGTPDLIAEDCGWFTRWLEVPGEAPALLIFIGQHQLSSNDQSMGEKPASSRRRFTALNGLDPRNPRLADSGLG